MPRELIAPETGAATSGSIGIKANRLPYTITAGPALVAAEVATIEYLGGNGTWIPLMEAGAPVGISANESLLSIFSPMTLRVQKGVTAGAVGIYGHWENNL